MARREWVHQMTDPVWSIIIMVLLLLVATTYYIYYIMAMATQEMVEYELSKPSYTQLKLNL